MGVGVASVPHPTAPIPSTTIAVATRKRAPRTTNPTSAPPRMTSAHYTKERALRPLRPHPTDSRRYKPIAVTSIHVRNEAMKIRCIKPPIESSAAALATSAISAQAIQNWVNR